VQPPVSGGGEQRPAVHFIEHVKTAKARQKGGDASLQGEAPFNHFEKIDTFFRLFYLTDGWKQNGGNHGNTTNPENNAQDMKSACKCN